MKCYSNWLISLQAVLVLTSCATAKTITSHKPDWVDNPGTGVSASAGMHVRGKAAQENLAILRAREEYAKRFGVNIHSEQTLATSVANDRSSSIGIQTAQEESNQRDIKALVKSKWYDQESDVLWIWLVPSDQ